MIDDTREIRTHRAPPRRARTVVITAAVVLALVAVVSLGRVLLVVTHDKAVVEHGQAALDADLARQWSGELTGAKPKGPAPLGKGVWRLHIPRLGLAWVVVEGVADGDIAAAPGHYPGTAQPGQVGNVAVAGHREIGMFADLDDVTAGDWLIVETRSTWYAYRVTITRVVPPASWAEVAQVPPGMAGGKLLTLTTCWPRWDSTSRLIVHAVLDHTSPHAQTPPELETNR